MSRPATTTNGAQPSQRLSLSETVRLLLTRTGSGAGSSVTLARNAKGDTQIEVTVRTEDEEGLRTPEEAAARARSVYDGLRSAYPTAEGTPARVEP